MEIQETNLTAMSSRLGNHRPQNIRNTAQEQKTSGTFSEKPFITICSTSKTETDHGGQLRTRVVVGRRNWGPFFFYQGIGDFGKL